MVLDWGIEAHHLCGLPPAVLWLDRTLRSDVVHRDLQLPVGPSRIRPFHTLIASCRFKHWATRCGCSVEIPIFTNSFSREPSRSEVRAALRAADGLWPAPTVDALSTAASPNTSTSNSGSKASSPTPADPPIVFSVQADSAARRGAYSSLSTTMTSISGLDAAAFNRASIAAGDVMLLATCMASRVPKSYCGRLVKLMSRRRQSKRRVQSNSLRQVKSSQVNQAR